MSIADELRKLQELRDAGSLTEAEFAQAKAALLTGAPPAPVTGGPDGDSLPAEPNVGLTRPRLVTMQIVAGALTAGAVIFLGVVLFIVHGQRHGQAVAPFGGLPVVSLMAVVMLCICAPLDFVVPGIM